MRRKTRAFVNKKILSTVIFIGLVLLGLHVFAMEKNGGIKIDILPNSSQKNGQEKINVLVGGSIKEMLVEDYIVHVVAGEMPANYDIEALKAQAVAARTYTYKKLQSGGCKNGGAHMCDDYHHCQAYKENIPVNDVPKIRYAVSSTKDKIITYNGEPITALFHSASGGHTEDNVHVFGQDLPYLKGVVSEGEETSPEHTKKETRSVSEIKAKVKGSGNSITVIERLPSGRVSRVNVFGKSMTGKELRELINLSSANFSVKINGDKAVFTTVGYGHGVGLSQVGANYMAKNGKNYKEIIKHYYTDVEISSIK